MWHDPQRHLPRPKRAIGTTSKFDLFILAKIVNKPLAIGGPVQ